MYDKVPSDEIDTAALIEGLEIEYEILEGLLVEALITV